MTADPGLYCGCGTCRAERAQAVTDAVAAVADAVAPPAHRALDAALQKKEHDLWVIADHMAQRDLEEAFLAANKIQKVCWTLLNARQTRWEAGLQKSEAEVQAREASDTP